MKEYHFYDRVYRRWLVVFIGSFEDLFKRLTIDGYTEVNELKLAQGMCIEMNDDNNTSGNRCTVIWLAEWNLATLVHEIAHACIFFFDEIGVPLSRDNTEGFAFYFEYWWLEITRAHKSHPEGRTPAQAKKG